jgi:hypothetical protein
MIARIIEIISPYWFKLFLIGIILGAFVAFVQKIKN